jgi:hypothetical protein
MANTHGVLNTMGMTEATHEDRLNATARYAAGTLDNGWVVELGAFISGESDVYTATLPSSASAALELWMVNKDLVSFENNRKGENPDPRSVEVAAGEDFSCFKVMKFDVIELSSTAITGTRTTEAFVNVATTGKLVWAASSTGATLFKLLEPTTTMIGGQNPSTYSFQSYKLQAIV